MNNNCVCGAPTEGKWVDKHSVGCPAALIPFREGFYWGQWRIKDEGTADENDPPGKEWEVMHVVENCIDETDDEYLMVMVPGVGKWQSVENFIWGDPVAKPPALRD